MNKDPSFDSILRKYKRNIYPPILGEADGQLARDGLRERGFTPRAGAIAMGKRAQTLNQLASLASTDLLLSLNTAPEDVIVGPHSFENGGGIDSNAISIWVRTRPE